jgi:hypothetical protein
VTIGAVQLILPYQWVSLSSSTGAAGAAATSALRARVRGHIRGCAGSNVNRRQLHALYGVTVEAGTPLRLTSRKRPAAKPIFESWSGSHVRQRGESLEGDIIILTDGPLDRCNRFSRC